MNEALLNDEWDQLLMNKDLPYILIQFEVYHCFQTIYTL